MSYLDSLKKQLEQENQDSNQLLIQIIKSYQQDLKSMTSSFKNITSREFAHILQCLELKKSKKSKMVLLVLTLMLKNPLFKIHFLEKCGLSITEGSVIITRLKCLSNYVNNSEQHIDFQLIQKLKKIQKFSQYQNGLFWFLNLKDLDLSINSQNLYEIKEMPIYCFQQEKLVFNNDQINLEKIPDPSKIIFGIELTSHDLTSYQINCQNKIALFYQSKRKYKAGSFAISNKQQNYRLYDNKEKQGTKEIMTQRTSFQKIIQKYRTPQKKQNVKEQVSFERKILVQSFLRQESFQISNQKQNFLSWKKNTINGGLKNSFKENQEKKLIERQNVMQQITNLKLNIYQREAKKNMRNVQQNYKINIVEQKEKQALFS